MPTGWGWGWRVAVIATILILFGNAAGLAAGPNVVTVSWATMAQTVGTLLIVIVASRWCGLTLAEAGIGRTNLLRSTLIGAGIGLGLAAVLLLALEVGAQLGTPITYQPLHGASISAVLTHALVGLPLQTAIPEELAFRGLVLGLLMRKLTPLRAALVTSAIFVAWHVVVQVQTLAVTNFTSPWQIVPAMGLAFAGLFAGGVIFALLRLRTRNLAAAVVAHWLFDAAFVTGLYFLTAS
ncbi:MAG TPA: CPBP family intramembrane glutamic endopeptidase [Candidatus Eisenbacteria bacterium]|nr:CPBP family intramembrane glutamic endopeptidase [Candidatus Eisenbacteria bacterium]